MVTHRKPGLWVLEAKWSSRAADVRTVDPILRALEHSNVARSVHHHVNDTEDFIRGLLRWGQKQHAVYGIGYVAMHGSPGSVHIGRRRVNLLDAASALPRGLLRSKVLHFGSCAVLENRSQWNDLLKGFGVRAITGFTEDVDWFESMAFELILFEALTYYKRMDAVESYIKTNHGQFAKRLGFEIIRRPR